MDIDEISKSEIVGVTSVASVGNISKLKQELLMFDRLTFSDDSFLSAFLRGKGMAYNANELEWLLEEGLIFKYVPKLNKRLERDSKYKQYLRLIGAIDEQIDKSFKESELSSRRLDLPGTDISIPRITLPKHIGQFRDEIFCRLKAYQLQRLESLQAYPLFYESAYTNKVSIPRKTKVIQISLGFLPKPDESTPWEKILDYRADPDSKGKFFALRNWMNEIARSDIDPREIEEKLEWLIYDYQRHLDLHRLKSTMGNFETIVVTTADILENLTKMRWGKLAQSFFSIRKRKIALLEAELTSPGAEVAYIVKTQGSFEGQKPADRMSN